MGAASNTGLAAEDQLLVSELPRTRDFLGSFVVPTAVDIPSTSGTKDMEITDPEVEVIKRWPPPPLVVTTEELRVTNHQVANQFFFKAMRDGLKDMEDRYQDRVDKLEVRRIAFEKAEDVLSSKVKEARETYQQQVEDILERERQLAAAK